MNFKNLKAGHISRTPHVLRATSCCAPQRTVCAKSQRTWFARKIRTGRCRFVNEVLQKGERVQDLFRRAPVERTHREIVMCPFSYGELLFEVLKRIEAMQSVELFVVLAVTALHFTVVPWGIWPYHFVTDAQFL